MIIKHLDGILLLFVRKNREWYFGKINNDVIILSDIGDIVKNYWFKITEHNENIALDEFMGISKN